MNPAAYSEGCRCSECGRFGEALKRAEHVLANPKGVRQTELNLAEALLALLRDPTPVVQSSPAQYGDGEMTVTLSPSGVGTSNAGASTIRVSNTGKERDK